MKAESVCIPKKYKILSGSVLKCIALFTMIVDHVGLHLLRTAGSCCCIQARGRWSFLL